MGRSHDPRVIPRSAFGAASDVPRAETPNRRIVVRFSEVPGVRRVVAKTIWMDLAAPNPDDTSLSTKAVSSWATSLRKQKKKRRNKTPLTRTRRRLRRPRRSPNRERRTPPRRLASLEREPTAGRSRFGLRERNASRHSAALEPDSWFAGTTAPSSCSIDSESATDQCSTIFPSSKRTITISS
jgi:hypothetical protein